MKHPLTTIGLLSAAMLATAAPTFAAPFQSERAPAQYAQSAPGERHERRTQGPSRHHFDKQDERRADRNHERRGPARHGLDLAGKLAAAETYVGITSAQEDAWRAYASALIAFFDRPALGPDERGPDRDRGPRGEPRQTPPAQDARSDAPQPRPLFAEHLAGRAIEQGEKAQALKAAVETLRSALSEEQLGRLAQAEDTFAPRHGGPRGPHGDAGGPGGQDRPERPAAPHDTPSPDDE